MLRGQHTTHGCVAERVSELYLASFVIGSSNAHVGTWHGHCKNVSSPPVIAYCVTPGLNQAQKATMVYSLAISSTEADCGLS
jgi:hypothetical protein